MTVLSALLVVRFNRGSEKTFSWA